MQQACALEGGLKELAEGVITIAMRAGCSSREITNLGDQLCSEDGKKMLQAVFASLSAEGSLLGKTVTDMLGEFFSAIENGVIQIPNALTSERSFINLINPCVLSQTLLQLQSGFKEYVQNKMSTFSTSTTCSITQCLWNNIGVIAVSSLAVIVLGGVSGVAAVACCWLWRSRGKGGKSQPQGQQIAAAGGSSSYQALPQAGNQVRNRTPTGQRGSRPTLANAP